MTATAALVADRFAARHPYWTRLEAVDVLRETARASRDLAQFAHTTNLPYPDALALWGAIRQTA